MSDWISLGNIDQFPENEAILVEDTPLGTLVVVFQNNKYFVLSGICSHEEFELGDSPVQDGQLTCILHMSAFNLETGAVLNPPAEEPLSAYDTKVTDNTLFCSKKD